MLDIQTRYSLKGWVREDEVPDITELLGQITTLKKEKAELEDQLKVLESGNQDKVGDYTFDSLKKLLKRLITTIPDKVTNNGDMEANAYDVMLLFRRKLSAGIDNRLRQGDLNTFLYYSLCPHLRIHELTEIVKVNGMAWTTFQTSKLGNNFLSLAAMKGERSELTVSDGVIKKRKEPKAKVDDK